ncbi:MAG: beta-propeller fold lactonase family protein [Planctomycetaceae bacterium]|nr:beta-propeller fold lactonase family protein [Planctomycetaceae bacterium]
MFNIPVKSVSLFACCLLTAVATISADQFVYVSLLKEKQILVYHQDARSGILTKKHTVSCPAEPAYLASSRDGRWLLASLRSTGQLASFRIDPADGSLTLLNVVEGGEDPAFLITDWTDRFLLTAYYIADQVTVHRIGPDGRLQAEPVQTVPTADNAHGIAVNTSNTAVFVPHTGANCVYQFAFDGESGRLKAANPPLVAASVGQNPRHVVLHPNDKWAFTSNEAGASQEDGVSRFDITEQNTLVLRQSLSSLPSDFDAGRNSTSRCQITPNGRFVYVANRGHHSIAGFSVDQNTGELTSLGQTPTEPVPRSFCITPDGRFLYAAGEASGRLVTYAIEPNGNLMQRNVQDAGPVAWGVHVVSVPERR